jgi:DNA polymerase-3 subunit delta
LIVLPVKLDRQIEGSRWFEALNRAGVVIEANPVTLDRLPRWIGARLALQRQEASPETLQFIAERVEGNLLAAHQEVQKLGLLFPAGHLDFEQVKNAVLNVARYDVFKLGEAMLAGDASRLARFLDGLKSEGALPHLVLGVIASEIRALVRVARAIEAGQQPADAIRQAKIWGPKQRLIQRAVRWLSVTELEDALLQAASIDRMIKGIAKGDPWDAMLGLVLRFARPAYRGAETA